MGINSPKVACGCLGGRGRNSHMWAILSPHGMHLSMQTSHPMESICLCNPLTLLNALVYAILLLYGMHLSMQSFHSMECTCLCNPFTLWNALVYAILSLYGMHLSMQSSHPTECTCLCNPLTLWDAFGYAIFSPYGMHLHMQSSHPMECICQCNPLTLCNASVNAILSPYGIPFSMYNCIYTWQPIECSAEECYNHNHQPLKNNTFHTLRSSHHYYHSHRIFHCEIIITMKVSVMHKILSIETVLRAYTHTHAHLHTQAFWLYKTKFTELKMSSKWYNSINYVDDLAVKTIWQFMQNQLSCNSLVAGIFIASVICKLQYLNTARSRIMLLSSSSVRVKSSLKKWSELQLYIWETQKRKKSTFPLGLELIFAGEVVEIVSFINWRHKNMQKKTEEYSQTWSEKKWSELQLYIWETQKRKKSTFPLGLELIFAGEVVEIVSFINWRHKNMQKKTEEYSQTWSEKREILSSNCFKKANQHK